MEVFDQLGNVTISFTYQGTPEQEAYVTEQVKLIAASLTKDGMSDFDKVRAVNDYVVTHTVYSKTAKTTPHHIYAYLKEGKAVCQAYALLTYRLLDEMGVEVRYVTGFGQKEAHAWNSVKIDGKWYHMDTTWNDGNDFYGNTSYKYFLVTSETLAKDHTWEQDDYPVATDDSYSYLHDVYMGVEYKGTVYYSSYANNNKFYKLDLSTKTSSEVLNKRVLYLAAHNDKIYFSDYSNGGYLTAYDIKTNATEVVDATYAVNLNIVDDVLKYKDKTSGKQKSYELPLTEDQQKVKSVKNAINAIKTTSKTFIGDVDKASELFTALDENLKSEVTNSVTLSSYVAQAEKAKLVYNAINELDGSSVEAIQKAREAYDELTKAEKVWVSNYTTLTKKEAEVKAAVTAIAAIEAIDPVSTKFVSQVTAARTAYTKAGAKQDLVTNYDKLVAIEPQAAVITQISQLKTSSKTYIADVTKAKAAFDALEENKYVPEASVTTLTTAVEAIKPAQAVVTQIEALDGTSVKAIQDARDAYDNLDKAAKAWVTNYTALTKKEAEVKAAVTAIEAIEAIDPESTKFISQVTAARTAYTKAGAKQNLVTNYETLEKLEAQAEVITLISQLKTANKTYIADVTEAKAAFDALEASDYVTNDAKTKLSTAVEAIKPAQDVVAQIDELDGTSIQAILEAREAYDNLTKAAKVWITNLADLTSLEKTNAAVIKVIGLIETASATDVSKSTFLTNALAMKKAFVALTDDQKASITNADDYNYYVALYEIKNAQKTRKWTEVTVETFEALSLTGVTEDNLEAVIAGFNALKAGTGTSTVEEIQEKITSFVSNPSEGE